MRKTAKILWTICLAVLLGGPVGAGWEEGPPPLQAREERLIGIAVYPEKIQIDVASSGCTTAEDFVFVLELRDPSRVELLVIRIREDACDGPERTVTLDFSRGALGLDGVDTICLRNEFRGDPPPRW